MNTSGLFGTFVTGGRSIHMRRFRRLVFVFLALAVTGSGSAAWAKAPSRQARRPAKLLHLRWHVIAPGGVQRVLASGRYVFIGKSNSFEAPNGSEVVIDDQTGRRVVLTPPSGCYFDNANSAALGGWWVVATCNPPPPGPHYLYELYSIPHGTWTPFTPNVKQMFAFNADCKTSDPQCGISYTAVGAQWIEFQITCGYHCGPTTFSFQNIQSGQVDDQPPDWRSGGTEIPDLNSPTLTRKLCSPLRVPHGLPDAYAATTPGGIVFAGRSAVALDWYQSSSGLEDQRYVLERCGTHLHGLLLNSVPGGLPLAMNSHAVIWPGLGLRDKTIHGVFLPSRHPVKITNLPASMPPGPTEVALTPRRIYALVGGSRLYAATAPRQPNK